MPKLKHSQINRKKEKKKQSKKGNWLVNVTKIKTELYD